jgi:hypothetical protein
MMGTLDFGQQHPVGTFGNKVDDFNELIKLVDLAE